MTTSDTLREAGVHHYSVTPVALEFRGSVIPTPLIDDELVPTPEFITNNIITVTAVENVAIRLSYDWYNEDTETFWPGIGTFKTKQLEESLAINTTVPDPPIYVRVRMRRITTGDEAWLGKLKFAEFPDPPTDEGKRQFAPEPDWSVGWVTVVWDMTTPDAGTWIGHPNISRLQFEFLTGAPLNGTVFEIASINVDNGIPLVIAQLPFTVHDVSSLLVSSVDPVSKAQSPLLLNDDYTVTTGSLASGGGVFTLISSLITDRYLHIRRLSSPRNDLSLTGTTLPIPETEETFDRFANYHADLLGELDRCVKLSDGEPTPSSQGKISIPEDRKGNFLKYDETTGELTHSPKLDGVVGPQGVQGDGGHLLYSYADTGGFPLVDSSFSLVGTSPISTSRSGDTIYIASANIPGNLDQLATDMGGTTTGSVVALSGDSLTDTTRSVDTITINSISPTHAAGSAPNPALDFSTERKLLSTGATGLVNTFEAQVVDWPTSYRSIELEFFEFESGVQSVLDGYIWDATNNLPVYDSLLWLVTKSLEHLDGFVYPLGSGTQPSPSLLSATTYVTGLSKGVTGSIKLTHVGNNMIFGKSKSQSLSQSYQGFPNARFITERYVAQHIPLGSGITHDGIYIQMYDWSSFGVTNFSGSYNIWGYSL